MPDIESAVVAIIKASPAVVALLGTPITRFYPDTIPIGVVYPASAYQRIVSVPMSRKLSTPRPAVSVLAQLTTVLIQVTVHAKSASDRSLVSEAIREALVGHQREVWANVFVNVILPPSGQRGTHNATTGIYERQLDFPIWFAET